MLKQKTEEYLGRMKVYYYPYDVIEELRVRVQTPSASLLVIPDGRVKLIGPLPFICAHLAKHSLRECLGPLPRGLALAPGERLRCPSPREALARLSRQRLDRIVLASRGLHTRFAAKRGVRRLGDRESGRFAAGEDGRYPVCRFPNFPLRQAQGREQGRTAISRLPGGYPPPAQADPLPLPRRRRPPALPGRLRRRPRNGARRPLGLVPDRASGDRMRSRGRRSLQRVFRLSHRQRHGLLSMPRPAAAAAGLLAGLPRVGTLGGGRAVAGSSARWRESWLSSAPAR